MGARTVAGKIVAVVFPISAFVAAGFEHCVANMYLIPLGMVVHNATGTTPQSGAPGFDGLINNLIPVTLGNLVGGAVLVAAVYWAIYRRQSNS